MRWRKYGFHLEIPPDTPLKEIPFCVVDTETASAWSGGHLLEVAAVRIHHGEITDVWDTLVNPQTTIDPQTTAVHGITALDVRRAPLLHKIIPLLSNRMAGHVLVAHNAPFDEGVLSISYARTEITPPRLPFIDTLKLARTLLALDSNRLQDVALHLNVASDTYHRAAADALVTARILLSLMDRLEREGTGDLQSLVHGFSTAVLGQSIAPFEPPHRLPQLMLSIYARAEVEIIYKSHSGEHAMPVRLLTAFKFRDADYVEAWHMYFKKRLTLRADRIMKIGPLPWP